MIYKTFTQERIRRQRSSGFIVNKFPEPELYGGKIPAQPVVLTEAEPIAEVIVSIDQKKKSKKKVA